MAWLKAVVMRILWPSAWAGAFSHGVMESEGTAESGPMSLLLRSCIRHQVAVWPR
jgi:hypothetical protein